MSSGVPSSMIGQREILPALDSFDAELLYFRILRFRNNRNRSAMEDTEEIVLVELFTNVYRRIMKRLAPLARQEGLSMSELALLWKAHQCGSRRVTAFSEDLNVPPSTLTGMMDRLVEAGWLARDRDPEDRRAVVMKTTPRLNELVKNLTQAANRSMEKALRALPSQTRDRLVQDLTSLQESLDREEFDR